MQGPHIELGRTAAWRFLVVSTSFFLAFGVATALFGELPPASIWREWIAEHFFAGPMPPDAAPIYDFMRGPLGGTMAGSYTLQLGLVAVPMRRGERWAAAVILASVGVWFGIDCAVSISHGAWFNVWRINTTALVVTVGSVIWWFRTRRRALQRTPPRPHVTG